MDRVPLTTILAYSLPTFFIAVAASPFLIVLPTLYAQYTSVSLAQIGLVLLVARLVDAVIDPAIGFMSDRTRSPWGNRKPWIVIGCALITPTAWFLFRPSTDSDFLYFIICTGLFTLGGTLVGIPTSAWGAELTRNETDRTRIFTIRSMLLNIGGVMYAFLPILAVSRYGSMSVSMLVMHDIATISVIAIPLSVVLMVILVPHRTDTGNEQTTLRGVWETLVGNRLLWRYFATIAVTGIGLGMYYGLLYLFFVDHMKLGEAFPYIAIVSASTIFAVSPLWMRLIIKYGKANVWRAALLFAAPISPLIWFFEPGPQALIPVFMLTIVGAAILACHFAAAPALLSDIIDYDNLRTGSNKAGNIFSLSLVISKAAFAGGAGSGLLLVGLFGYQPGAENGSVAVFGLAFGFSILPSLLLAAGGLVLLKYPVSKHKQTVITRRLQQRTERMKELMIGQ